MIEPLIQAALDSLPDDLRNEMSNVEIVVEDEPPPGQPLLGLYQGIPLTRRGSSATPACCPTRSRSTAARSSASTAHDPELLERQVRRVVLHEIAHHFGISDERLVELDRY